MPVDKAYDGKTYAFAALEARAENAHLLDTEPPKAVEGIRLIKGRPSKKCVGEIQQRFDILVPKSDGFRVKGCLHAIGPF